MTGELIARIEVGAAKEESVSALAGAPAQSLRRLLLHIVGLRRIDSGGCGGSGGIDGEGRIISINLNERERELGLIQKAAEYVKQP